MPITWPLLTRNLGLPAPLVLDRFDASKPLVNGAVLLGAAPNAELIAPIAKVLKNIHADVYAGHSASIHQIAASVQVYHYVLLAAMTVFLNLKPLSLMQQALKTANN